MVNQVDCVNPRIDDLNKRAKIDLKNRKIEDVAKRLREMCVKGLSFKQANKLDNAFIILKKYINTVDWIKKQSDYRRKQDLIKSYFPDSDVTKVEQALESIEYEFNKIYSIPKDVIPANDQSKCDDENLNNVNFPETPTDDPVNGETEGFITCEQLHKLLPKSRYLIIDVRPAADYNQSRILSRKIINIPASEIKFGITANKIGACLKGNALEFSLYDKRSTHHLDLIILVDWSTTPETHNPDKLVSAVSILIRILQKWDPGNEAPTINILKGGYNNWLHCYPNTTTNPNVESHMDEDIPMSEILENVEYPSWLKEDEIILPNVIETMKINHNDHKKTGMIIDSNSSPANVHIYNSEMTDLHSLSQEMSNIHIMRDNNDVSFNITKPPSVDRSSKPIYSAPNTQVQLYLRCLNKIKELSDSQEKLEKQLCQLYDEEYLRLNHRDDDPEDLESKRSVVEMTLKEITEDKSRHKSELEELTEKGVISSAIPELMRIELRIYDVETRIQQNKSQRESILKNQEKNRKNLLSSKPNNLTYKEPLKDSTSTNGGLKRSLSSPNLAQVKKSKTENMKDRNVPHIDRSSKPPDVHKNRESNNNMISRDPAKRMDAVFRDGLPGITGLKNLGNSCYMNSILQCLSNTSYLTKYFIDNSYLDDVNTSDNVSRGQIVEEFAQVIKALWRGQYRSIAPHDLKITVGQYKVEFQNCDQQDSHEFLTFFLDWIHNDLCKNDKMIRNPTLTAAEKEWDKSLNNKTSVISQLFFGQLRSTVSCSSCGSRSVTYETFNSLTISLPETNKCSLDDCLRNYTTGQRISEWQCPKCKIPRDAVKKFDFVKLPSILIIHLNRFVGVSNSKFEKKDTHVIFPINDLNIQPYVVRDNESLEKNRTTQCTYNLYALSTHYGTMTGGHYTAYCKSANLNKWYEYNDQNVVESSESIVKNQNRSAYLLFYSSIQRESYAY